MADAKKTATADRTGKDLPAPAPARKGGLVQFVREIKREGWDKVTWPSWRETYLTTIMVFIMVGITMVFFFGVDALLAAGERWVVSLAG